MENGIELKVIPALRKMETGLGRARMDQASREKLGLSLGDLVEIVGKKGVAGKVFKDLPAEYGEGVISVDGLTRTDAGVVEGDTVKVYKREVVPAAKVTLAPNIEEGKRISFKSDISLIVKKGLFNRPVLKGNAVVIPNLTFMGATVAFNVVTTSPAGVVMVGPDTEITVNNEPVVKKESKGASFAITYDDVGGLNEELKRIREMIELPLRHPELFERLGISAPKGVLLYGPPGTGKTLIAKAVAKESGASFFSIQGPEIISRFYGESEEALRSVFRRAEENAPSIVFIDEIDSIAPNRDSVNGEVERRVVAQLLTLLDGLAGRGDVIVIGATNREDAIDPALRRPGRFDREIEIGVPGRKGRAEILDVHLRGMQISDDVDIEKLATMTQGFVGADLAALAREAAMGCLSRNLHLFDKNSPISDKVMDTVKVTMKDFTEALNDVEPSGMREVLADIPKTKWSDIGGLESIKKEIREVFVPEEEAKDFQRLGISVPRGILLYGPPGTGKTLIAKAVANESGANFISVNGPEIASKWMGETEKAIRQVFKRAKQMAPCIIFFDEIDSIAPRRSSEGNGAWERVVNQLLTAMDGMEDISNVTVIGATNRPDMIDPALLRPGRFDKKVFIGLPNEEEREAILRIQTASMPLAFDIKQIAALTEGYVGADLSELVREAGMAAYREDKNIANVERRHFETALKLVLPSVSENDLKAYESAETEMRKRKTNHEDVPFYG